MRIHKRTALGVVGALAAGSLAALALGATPAQAATGSTAGLNGSPTNQIGMAAYNATGAITVTAVQSGLNADVSINVATGPTNPISPVTGGTYRLDAIMRVDGAANARGANWIAGTVGAASPAGDVPVGGQYYPSGTTYNTTVTGLSLGAHSFTLTDLIMDSNGGTSGGAFASSPAGYVGFDSWYNRGTNVADIVSGTGSYAEVGPTESLTLAALPAISMTPTANNMQLPNLARAGDQFPISLANFPANTAVTINAVAITGAPVQGALGTVTTDGAGAYSGLSPAITAAVAATSNPHRLQAVAGAASATTPATTAGVFALYGNPTITVPSPMSVGASYTISGTNWDAGETVNIAFNGGTTTATATASVGTGFALGGSWSVNVTPAAGDVSTTTVTASQVRENPALTLTASASTAVSAMSCIANPQCSVIQTLEVEVTPDANGLKLGETDNFTDFGTVATSPNAQPLPANLDTTTVYDGRGGSVGWSSVAYIANPFTGQANAAHQIPQSNLTIAVTCAPSSTATPANGPASVSAPLTGNTATTSSGSATAFPLSGSIANSVPLCSVPNVPAGNGGTWTQALAANLTVPAYQAADTYQTVMTVVLTSN